MREGVGVESEKAVLSASGCASPFRDSLTQHKISPMPGGLVSWHFYNLKHYYKI